MATADDRLDTEAFVVAVSPLFEGAPAFLRRLADARPFGSTADLFATAREIAHAMPEADQIELIDAHPRLGAAPALVSASSFVEQGYDREPRPRDDATSLDDARTTTELARLNAAYEARFGFRYCVFVAGRPRSALLSGIAAAVDADRASEIGRALDAVIDIARDRHAKMTR
jgi:2-oxo-4-hydroxy-4-carboxy-5-ureidoimidazoline decarboxylase